jgi:hypothetical protein
VFSAAFFVFLAPAQTSPLQYVKLRQLVTFSSSFVLQALSIPCHVIVIAPSPSPHTRIEKESQLFLNALAEAQ